MRVGIVTPVVSLNPRIDPPAWERDGTVDDVVAVAQAADRLGFAFVTCPEHVAVPSADVPQRGGRYWHPLATLSYLAACTERIGLLSHVVVLGYHHPLEIVKGYGTLDVLSGGRVILGVGVGSLRPEFDLLGRPFDDRGERADEAIRAMRASFGNPSPAHDGHHYSFGDVEVDPCGLDRHLPIWVGGRTRRSLRRALELGDGWIPFGLDHDQLAALLAGVDLDGRGEPFDVVLSPAQPLDPLGDRDAARASLARLRDLGATTAAVRLRARSRDHYVEQLESLAGVDGVELADRR